jgi:hypothetical protein
MSDRPPKLLSKLQGRPLLRRLLLAEVLGPPRAREPFRPRQLHKPPPDEER